MVQDCKYRLPCFWCDKYDRPCQAVEFEIAKQEHEKQLNKTECDHIWSFYESVIHTGGTDDHYRCVKCGALKIEDGDGCTYEIGEWAP